MDQETVETVMCVPPSHLEHETMFPAFVVESMKPMFGTIVSAHPSIKLSSHSVLVFLPQFAVDGLGIYIGIASGPQENDSAMVRLVFQPMYCMDRERHPVPVFSQPYEFSSR